MGKVIMSGIVPTLKAPVTGVLASSLAVGSTVKLMEGGTAVEYLVVNQGIPENSSLYDSSCNGTWLLRKDCLAEQYWGSALLFKDSVIETWLDNDFSNTFGTVEQATIKQVKIPYCTSAMTGSVASGVNGLIRKIFFLSAVEMGRTGTEYPVEEGDPIDGSKLSYFESGTDTSANNKRIAYLESNAVKYYTRSPHVSSTPSYIAYVGSSGNITYGSLDNNDQLSPRPALILPFTAKFDKDTKILKG